MSAGPSERLLETAAPTKKTLVFPAVEVPRSWRRPPPVPAARPSERPTLPTLPPGFAATSRAGNEVVELSGSALQSGSALDLGSIAGLDESEGSVLDLDRLRERRTTVTKRRRALGHLAVASLGALGALVGVVVVPGGAAALAEQAMGVPQGLEGPARVPREPASQHTALGPRPVAVIVAPAGGCAATGAPRVLAARAELAPGLDVSAAGGGFGVGFAASAGEARGMWLDGSPLRVSDRFRLRSAAGSARVRHVAVNAGHEEDALDVRVDADDARTVVPEGEAPAFRIAVAGDWVQASTRGWGKALWPAPGAGGTRPRRGTVAAPDVRAAAREDGGAVVALRRSPTLWLGLVDRHLAASGPLLALTRHPAAIGMPAVAPLGGGGVVAWAERPAGDRDWTIVVASFGTGADGSREVAPPRVIAPGMSPSIAALPDGDVLLAYAAGAPGSHRVVVQRLARDLEPRGEPFVVSPDALNAGQPAAAVAADGRALVAFFGAERGGASSVLATPLTCDPGL